MNWNSSLQDQHCHPGVRAVRRRAGGLERRHCQHQPGQAHARQVRRRGRQRHHHQHLGQSAIRAQVAYPVRRRDRRIAVRHHPRRRQGALPRRPLQAPGADRRRLLRAQTGRRVLRQGRTVRAVRHEHHRRLHDQLQHPFAEPVQRRVERPRRAVQREVGEIKSPAVTVWIEGRLPRGAVAQEMQTIDAHARHASGQAWRSASAPRRSRARSPPPSAPACRWPPAATRT